MSAKWVYNTIPSTKCTRLGCLLSLREKLELKVKPVFADWFSRNTIVNPYTIK